MKKVIYIIISILILSQGAAFAATSLTLSAIVGNSNHAPVVTLVDPSSDPRYLNNSTVSNIVSQSYLIKFRDDETDEVTYTITAEDGSLTVENGTIIPTQYDENNEAYISFDYISPTTEVHNTTVTITISDGANVTVQTLNIYIY